MGQRQFMFWTHMCAGFWVFYKVYMGLRGCRVYMSYSPNSLKGYIYIGNIIRVFLKAIQRVWTIAHIGLFFAAGSYAGACQNPNLKHQNPMWTHFWGPIAYKPYRTLNPKPYLEPYKP